MEKHYCCVPKCHSTYKQNTNRLYLMPRLQEIEENNHHTNHKNKTATNERRHQWIINTGCVDISPHDMYVCQQHFVKGKMEIPL